MNEVETETKEKRPSLSTLIRDGDIWWTKINDQWIKCIPYNIREKVVEEPSKESEMDSNQFTQIMNQMISMENRFDQRFDMIEKRIDSLEGIVYELRDIVKKNHPDDFT